MSVYKPPLSPFFHFDFQLQSRRYYGSTKRTDRREAKAVERAQRERAKNTAALAGATFHAAGQDGADNTLRDLARLGLHERIAAKFAAFQKLDIKPQGFLYRHFEPNGDLLHVGVTLSILDRTDCPALCSPPGHQVR